MGDRLKEQCLIIESQKGVVVITGCSHPGIAEMLTGIKKELGKPIFFVMGGFHLLRHSQSEVEAIAQTMKKLKIRQVGATHCSGDNSIAVFKSVYGDGYIPLGAGKEIRL